MDIYSIFNILILSICVATVLVTMVTYFYYKIRLVASDNDDEKKTEGEFFRLYIPESDHKVDIEIENNDVDNRNFLNKIFHNISLFFGILVLIVFTTLLFQNYYSRYNFDSKRNQLVEDFKLIQQRGLLKEYDFNFFRANEPITEKFSQVAEVQLNGLVEILRTKEIALFSSGRNMRASGYHKKSIESWITFLSKNKINYKLINYLSFKKKFDLIIFPYLPILSIKQRKNIMRIAKLGTGILSTGPFGVYEQPNSRFNSEWTKDILGIEFYKNKDDRRYFSSAATANVAPWAEITPGTLLDWKPEDNSFIAISRGAKGSLFEVSHKGIKRQISFNFTNYNIVRVTSHSTNNFRASWLAVKPFITANKTQQFYSNLALISSMAWTANIPILKISNWKYGKKSATLVPLEASDNFIKIEKISEIFSDFKFPSTFFLASNHIKKLPQLFNKESNSIEMATLGTDYTIVDQSSLKGIVLDVEQSRFTIEKATRKKVLGIRVIDSKISATFLNGSVQNKLAYIYGGDNYNRLGPLFLNNKDLIYIPFHNFEDLQIKNDHRIKSKEEAVQKIMREFKRVDDIGGLFVYLLHTYVFKDEVYFGILEEALKSLKNEKTWHTNFKDLVSWWKQRDKIKVNYIVNKVGGYQVKINNTGKNDVSNFSIYLDIPKSFNAGLVSKKEKLKIIKNKDNIEIYFKTLRPNQIVHLSIDPI